MLNFSLRLRLDYNSKQNSKATNAKSLIRTNNRALTNLRHIKTSSPHSHCTQGRLSPCLWTSPLYTAAGLPQPLAHKAAAPDPVIPSVCPTLHCGSWGTERKVCPDTLLQGQSQFLCLVWIQSAFLGTQYLCTIHFPAALRNYWCKLFVVCWCKNL